MEDAATAEISRSQGWQWIRHGTPLAGGGRVTRDLARRACQEEIVRLRRERGGRAADTLDQARALFEDVVLGETFVEFLTIPGYAALD